MSGACWRILCVWFGEGNGTDGTDGTSESDGTSEAWEPRGIFQIWVTGLFGRGRWGAWFVLTGVTWNLAGWARVILNGCLRAVKRRRVARVMAVDAGVEVLLLLPRVFGERGS